MTRSDTRGDRAAGASGHYAPLARFLVGDVFERMAEIPDGSIDLVLTSPPFLALRSYLPADHPDKGREIGGEPTPADFVNTLLRLSAEFRRVLTEDGSIAVELGDTYSGSGGAGGDYSAGGLRDGQEAFDGSSKRRRKANGYPDRDDTPRPPRNGRRSRAADEEAGVLAPRSRPGPEGRDNVAGWPMDKSLCLVPELYRVALAYGLNPLTGEQSPAGRWRVRNNVRWCRPNPPVGALGDKFRPGTSDIVVACVSRTRWFDLDAVRTEAPRTDNKRTLSTQYQAPGQPERKTRASDESGARLYANENGAPPLDWWEIPTQPYPGSHYAAWPPALCVKPIKAMCPPGGVVLDPFAGSGTTLAVASGLGRRSIGIDLDERNADLAVQRVGMFLEVENRRALEAAG